MAQRKRAREKAAGDEGATRLPAPAAVSLPPPRRPLPPHRLVLAPMVGGSELAFRLLARRHGTELCYTPMMYSAKLVADAAYRKAELRTHALDAPLVAHICGNDPTTMLAAAKLAEPHCVAVDINLGCPQRIAHSGHFGAYLLGESDRALVLSIVRTLVGGLKVPVFCKIRLLDEPSETLAFCRQLADAGCSLIAVHARYRGSATRRRDGPAHLEQVASLKRALRDRGVPLLANGNVRTAEDVLANLALTRADGVMSAEGMLDDPALFARASRLAHRLRAALRTKRDGSAVDAPTRAALLALPRLPRAPASAAEGGEGPSAVELAVEYLELADAHRAPLSFARFHVARLCRAPIGQFGLADMLADAADLRALRALVERCRAQLAGEIIESPAEVKAREAEAAWRKVCAAKRREFEERLQRKARREGRDDDHYLAKGRAPPSAAAVAEVRGLGASARIGWWSARYGQHCLQYHVEGKCDRAQSQWGCAFLHEPVADAKGAKPRQGGGGAAGADADMPDWLREDVEARARGRPPSQAPQ